MPRKEEEEKEEKEEKEEFVFRGTIDKEQTVAHRI